MANDRGTDQHVNWAPRCLNCKLEVLCQCKGVCGPLGTVGSAGETPLLNAPGCVQGMC